MFDNYYTPAGIPRERIEVFDGLNPDLEAEKSRIARWIQDRGGIGFSLLGIGMNGHVGFNEPGAGLPTGCIDIALDETTRRVSRKYFDSPLSVKRGVGVGAGTLKQAGRLILMADGARKAEIVCKTLLEPPTDRVPASLMADHPNASIFLDEAAAALVAVPGSPNIPCPPPPELLSADLKAMLSVVHGDRLEMEKYDRLGLVFPAYNRRIFIL